MSSLVSVKNIYKNFDDFQAVGGVSFDVARKEVLGFLGPNGAGKTTTMRMITGYLKPTKGTIKVGGEDVSKDLIAVQKKIGYLPEGGPLYSDMTPSGFLSFICKVRGLDSFNTKERIDFVVESLNLNDVFYKTIETLSKGYKRRVALAQAIIHDPEVLILDEPTDGLDPNQKHEVRELIKQMSKDKAIVISTHILEEVDAVCTNAIIISGGKIVASGEPKDLLMQDPSHNSVYVKLFKTPADTVLNEILQLRNVDRVNVETANSIRAYPKKGKSILAQVSAAVRKKKVPVDTIYEVHGSLNDSFRNSTKKHPEN